MLTTTIRLIEEHGCALILSGKRAVAAEVNPELALTWPFFQFDVGVQATDRRDNGCTPA
jgi:hypothetical protein